MKRTWTILGVGDVARSFRWYQSLLGLDPAEPAHDNLGQIVDVDETGLLCLHAWGDHDHPTLLSPETAAPGNGLLLFLRVDDFDAALSRARSLVARLEEEPAENPNTGTREFSLRDPDGYWVTISSLTATDDSPPRPDASSIDTLSDAQIREIADSLMDNLMDASTAIDHARHVRDFTARAKAVVTPEHLQRVCERYQAEKGFFAGRDFVTVLRRPGTATIVWKQRFSRVPGDFLAEMILVEQDGRFLIDHVAVL